MIFFTWNIAFSTYFNGVKMKPVSVVFICLQINVDFHLSTPPSVHPSIHPLFHSLIHPVCHPPFIHPLISPLNHPSIHSSCINHPPIHHFLLCCEMMTLIILWTASSRFPSWPMRSSDWARSVAWLCTTSAWWTSPSPWLSSRSSWAWSQPWTTSWSCHQLLHGSLLLFYSIQWHAML